MYGNAITMDLLIKFNMDVSDLGAVDIIVSFIKKSGYDQIEFFLKSALEHNVPIRILTSTYMSITDPVALSRLIDLLGEGNVKLYNGGAPSFHPKAYFFKSKSDENRSYLLVGSSNISKPALTKGVEWNYQVNCSDDPEAYYNYQSQFEDLFNNHAYVLTEKDIKEYRETLIVQKEKSGKNNINKYYMKHIRSENRSAIKKATCLYRPNQPQDEALFELKKTREDGNDKALVVAATGVGKTFLAAFDSLEYNTVLFVAHREEILNQAYNTFAKVRGDKKLGRYFASFRDVDCEVLFASVQTLSMEKHLTKFNKNSFEYIVIDEFHHVAAPTYRTIIDYFVSTFFLGLTATPYRLDKKDILQLCDYNVAYEANLFSAINRDWLVPFYYYGIYDDTVEYDNIRFINGKYIDKELSKVLRIEKRAELIYKHYMKHKRKGTIGFCVDIDHAEEMATYFKGKGSNAVTMHSDFSRENIEGRATAIEKMKTGEIEIIFAVDMLNEGVDIPEIDLLLFLRPTESPTVFFQQLGRGLRHSEEKAYLKVLDFIGNYRKVEMLPFWLSGKTGNSLSHKQTILNELIQQNSLPEGCYIDFDLQVIDIFKNIFTSKRKIQDLIEELYNECKMLVGHIPTRMEFFEHLDNVDYDNIKKTTKLNPFRNYMTFINRLEQGYIPEGFLDSDALKFINMLETTSMQALYKVAMLKAFIKEESVLMEVGREEIEASFYEFYKNKRNWPDLARHKTRKDFKEWESKDYWELAQENPVHFLSKTHSDIFEYDKKTSILSIKLDLSKWIKSSFFVEQVKDCLEFRRAEFLDKRLQQT